MCETVILTQFACNQQVWARARERIEEIGRKGHLMAEEKKLLADEIRANAQQQVRALVA